MSEYKQTIYIDAPIQDVYDCCLTYFSSIGYVVKGNAPPVRIEFSKKGTLWTTDDIDAPHNLSIHLHSEGNKVVATIHFNCEAGIGSFSKRSRQIIDSEIATLTGMISLRHKPSDRICVECKKNIPFDVNICPYCGHNYLQPVSKEIPLPVESTQTQQPLTQAPILPVKRFCTHCGQLLSPEGKFCQYCGAEK
ncbi:MAG: zinc ribbon domain-containing protein [Candidatus Thermoplasmatota archaeon]